MRHRGAGPAARDRAPAAEERSLTASLPRFIGAFPRADTTLDPPLPEIALVGRANVGKSSLLNALTGTRIARVSGTPGKTRMLHVYQFDAARQEQGDVRSELTPLPPPRSLYFLDLPGYGYSRASKTDRTAFRRLMTHALARPRLAGTLWLLDIRREPSREDHEVQDLLAGRGTAVLAAVTKSDKLPRGQRDRREGELRDALGLDTDQILVTSARTGEGVAELREAIGGLLMRVQP